MSELACHKSMVASRNEQQVITLIRASNFDSDVPYAYLQVRDVGGTVTLCGCLI